MKEPMTQPTPPPGPQRPPQVWDTRFDQRQTGPPGFGPAPVFGPPPQSSGGGSPTRGSGKLRKALAIGLGLLLVAGAGTGGWLLWGRDGNDSAHKKKGPAQAVDAKLEWVIPMPSPDKEHAQRMAPAWFVKDNVVMSTQKTVTAYNVETGKPSWTVPVPGFACNRSPEPDGGIAVVVYGKGEFECDLAMAVDLERGRTLWSKELTDSRGRKDSHDTANISFSRGVVTLSSGLEPRVFDARSGERRKPLDFGCRQQGAVADGTQQLTVAQCQIYGRQFVMNVDPRTGVEKWTWKVLDGITVLNVLSVQPPVLAVARENDHDPSDLVVLDDKGRLKNLISVSAGPYEFGDCKPRLLDSCRRAVTDGDTLYLATRSDKVIDNGSSPNAIASIDLKTGKARWTVPLAEDRTSRPVAMHEGRLLVYQQATRDESGKLLSLDPANGESTVFMKLPQDSVEREFGLRGGTAYFRDGRFYLVPEEGMTATETMMMSFH
ncbi:PQQ-binding-like beta-propeller repeat protein [Streptomyces sp. NPDC026206]|uniref:outer membrane protein assembly factor BamB family protein n=1 Tax=Streptomyces sp. NPDC026206 TaxID=3157089 RepID=UPI0033F39698